MPSPSDFNKERLNRFETRLCAVEMSVKELRNQITILHEGQAHILTILADHKGQLDKVMDKLDYLIAKADLLGETDDQG